jgi:hypothetical protein
VRPALRVLSWDLDWFDPDEGYDDDVLAYVRALRELARLHTAELETALPMPEVSNLADLNWIEGFPTGPGTWLVEYSAEPNNQEHHVLSLRVVLGDTPDQLAAFLPLVPGMSLHFRAQPLDVFFPGNHSGSGPTVKSSCLIRVAD